jgi:ketosteroid isomerase-like protein
MGLVCAFLGRAPALTRDARETGGDQDADRQDRPRRTSAIEVRGMGKARQSGERTVIAEVIRNNIMWALTKDVEVQKDTMAHDEELFYFWTGSTHVVSGWKEHKKCFEMWMDPRFKTVRTEVRDLVIHLSHSGDVAWYSATLDDVVSWDGKVSTFGEGPRWTGVLEKRDGRWVIVQMHASLAADKVGEMVLKEKETAV